MKSGLIRRMLDVFGVRPHFSKLDQIVLDNVREKLNTDLKLFWDKQISAINKIQRSPDRNEVRFYQIINGRQHLDEDKLFPNKQDEFNIATCKITWPPYDALYSKLWCVKGRIFSIEYCGAVTAYEEAVGMDPQPRLVIDCEVNKGIEDEYSIS